MKLLSLSLRSSRIFEESTKAMIEQLRDKAMKLCSDHGITVQPYAGAWWLRGKNINVVVGELAGLTFSDIKPLPITSR